MPYWLILYPSLMQYEVLPGRVCGRHMWQNQLIRLSPTYNWHNSRVEENGAISNQPLCYRPLCKQTCQRMIRTLAEGQGYTRLPGSRELP